MRELFERLDQCVKVAEQLSRYDDETQHLCGHRPECPFPELLTTWNGSENKVQTQRRYLKGWLD